MTSGDWYLGIDLGTSGVKVAAVAPAGTVLASAFAPIDTVLLPGGGAEQDTDTWWAGICSCVRSVTADPAGRAVTVSGRRHHRSARVDGAGRCGRAGRRTLPALVRRSWRSLVGGHHRRADSGCGLRSEEGCDLDSLHRWCAIDQRRGPDRSRATEKFAGRPLDGLRILGGGAQSALWCQIHADVIARPIEQIAEPMNVNVRGAAWFAAINLGHLTFDEIRQHRPVATTFTPSATAMRAYEPLGAEFTKLAKQQKSMYRRLNRRT